MNEKRRQNIHRRTIMILLSNITAAHEDENVNIRDRHYIIYA